MAEGDRRDHTTWVVLELTRTGESRVEEGTLAPALLEVLEAPKDHAVFIPSVTYNRGGHRVTVHLMEGYAFVASGLPETRYFALERESAHVKKVLATRTPQKIPVLSVVGDRDIDDMRRRLREVLAADIEEGMRVMITQGTYAHLDGEVLHVGKGDAQVLIELRSFKVIRSIPRVFLDPMGDEEDVG